MKQVRSGATNENTSNSVTEIRKFEQKRCADAEHGFNDQHHKNKEKKNMNTKNVTEI